MDLDLTSHGYLRSPDLHDGHVIGLHLVGKNARVTVTDVSGRAFVLELVGLTRLRCNEFAEGNIIHHIIVTTKAKPPAASLRKLLGEPHPSVGEPHRARHEAWIARCEQGIVDGNLSFVELQPNYGCELLALCESVNVEAHD
jgi:hypothetical protein